jgi:hypothetical protein
LVAMVADVAEGAQSPLEVEYLRRVERAHGLPAGVRNRRWGDRHVRWIDVDLDEFETRVELDGRLGHEDEGRFRDRRRDNRSTVSGKATLRYGHADVFGDPMWCRDGGGYRARDAWVERSTSPLWIRMPSPSSMILKPECGIAAVRLRRS